CFGMGAFRHDSHKMAVFRREKFQIKYRHDSEEFSRNNIVKGLLYNDSGM
ncbi:hypothetical protein STEG23_005066, partial [Scotinomys teguina]